MTMNCEMKKNPATAVVASMIPRLRSAHDPRTTRRRFPRPIQLRFVAGFHGADHFLTNGTAVFAFVRNVEAGGLPKAAFQAALGKPLALTATHLRCLRLCDLGGPESEQF